MAVTLDSLKKAIKKNKGRSQAMAWLADMERASGDYEAALKTVDAALAAYPSDVPAMLVRAKILAGQQDFAGSITEYKKVIAKDPFCLAAHKRMGESYDKLGKETERNACFRRVHDMDPLDTFWKDEYDVQIEEDQSVATMAPPPMDDESSFTMDLGNEPENTETSEEEDNVFADLASSLSNADDEDSSSMDALRDSLDIASDELAKSGAVSETSNFDDNALDSSEVTSAISGILGGEEDFDLLGGASKKEDSAASSLFSSFSDDEEKKNLDEPAESDNPFESLVEDKPSEVVEEAPSENLFSLDSLDEPQVAEEPAEKPAESAASPMHMEFSDEEAETESAEANLFDLDDSLDEKPKTEEPLMFEETPKVEESPVVEDAPKVAEAPKAEEPETNVNDAFSSIFGEDDLPEESIPVAEKPIADKPASDDSDFKFEEPAAELAEFAAPAEPAVEEPVAEKAAPISLDELAEEDSFSSLFEKSADADFSMDEKPAEEPSVTETVESVKPAAPAEEESFGGLFEKSADADFSMDETPAEKPVEAAPEESKPSENDVPATHMAFSEEESPSKLDDNFVLDLDEPAEETAIEKAPVFENPAAEVAVEKSPVVEESVVESAAQAAPAAAESSADNVDGAFDALFGEDELFEEPPAKAAAVEEPVAEAPVIEEAVSEKPVIEETLAEPAIAESAAPAETVQEPAPAPAAAESSADNVDGAFDALFGEDELFEEPPAKAAAVEEPVAEAPVIEEAVSEKPVVEETLAEPAVAESAAPAETVQESAPAPAAAKEEDVAKEMGGAFASMFGDEDDLDLPEEKTSSSSAPSSEPAEVALAEEPLSQEATGAEIEESSVKESAKDNVEDTVEESFENIFGADADDDLPEEKVETVAKAAPAAAPAEKPAPVEQPVEAEKPVDEVQKPIEESFDNIFGSADDDLPEEKVETVAKAAPAAAPAEKPASVEQPVEAEKKVAEVEKPAEKAEKAPSAELDSIDSEVSNAFAGLFDEDDSLPESDVPNNKGVDYLMSGDSDDEVSASLVNNAEAPLSRGAPDLDDSLNTRTLADIYMEQGVYNKALEIYADLAKKDPNNAEIKSRLSEIEKLCREKFGEG